MFVQSEGSPWNAFPIESTHIDVTMTKAFLSRWFFSGLVRGPGE